MHSFFSLRYLSVLCFSLLSIFSFSILSAEDNPLFSNPLNDRDWADPTVWQGDDGRYYTFSTSGAGLAHMGISYDMVNWDASDEVWDETTAETLRNIGTNLWAPQVTKVNDKWLMYLTCYNSLYDCSIVVLAFDSPTFPKANGSVGGWKYVRTLVSTTSLGMKDVIDPFVTEDPQTHKVWMFFGSTGGIKRIELTKDGQNLASKAEAIHVAGLDVDVNASRSKVFEGAYLYHHDKYWYLFVSSGYYNDHTYALKVGRSSSLTGTFVDKQGKPMTEGNATTLLSTPNANGQFWGPGHCAEIMLDDEGRSYMFYHCHSRGISSPTDGYALRPLMLQQIYWGEDGWPFFTDNAPQQEEEYPSLFTSYELKVSSAEWATLYLPFAFDIPDEVNVYSVTDTFGSSLHIERAYQTEANTPYLINAQPGRYALNGRKTTPIDNQVNGLLIGSLTGTTVPLGHYVLQANNGKVGFYCVTTDNIQLGQYHAYMLGSTGHAPAHHFYVEDETTRLNTINMDTPTEDWLIYTLFGQPKRTIEAGISILVSPDGNHRTNYFHL